MNTPHVAIRELWAGDRFRAHGFLWTYLGSGTARQHGSASVNLKERGFGYQGDVICQFQHNERVEFIPPPE